MKKGILNIEDITKHLDKESNSVLIQMMKEINPILDEINLNKNEILSTSQINYVLIRLVSYVENFFRNWVIQLIDVVKYVPKDIFPGDKITLSLEDFDKIKTDDKITKGRLIAYSINFQNLKEIDSTISKLVYSKSFFTILSQGLEKIEIKSETGEHHQFDWEKFNILFEERHNIVHRLLPSNKINGKQASEFFMQTFIFLTYCQTVLSHTFVQKHKEKLSKVAGTTLVRYQKITDEILKKFNIDESSLS